jgi:hypothetical protein
MSKNLILVCSCFLSGTKIEHIHKKEGEQIMWIKDAMAGAGLILFMASSFVLASGAHAVLHHIAT